MAEIIFDKVHGAAARTGTTRAARTARASGPPGGSRRETEADEGVARRRGGLTGGVRHVEEATARVVIGLQEDTKP